MPDKLAFEITNTRRIAPKPDAATVPEPASIALLGGSLALVGLIRRKKA